MPTITVTPEMARLLDEEFKAADERYRRDQRCLDQHGYGCARAECGRGRRGAIVGLRARG